MKLFGMAWGSAMGANMSDRDDKVRIRRDWDAMRASARTASERNEIDAIFSRYL